MRSYTSVLCYLLITAVMCLDQAIQAADTTAAPATTPTGETATAGEAVKPQPAGPPISADKTPRLVPWVDYSGGFFTRPALTGDWGGVRQHLMDKGLRFDVNLTQTYQGNVTGGTINRGYYQGGLRYELGLDTGYMGLWPGGMLTVRGETRYGKSDNFHTGSIMPVNTDSLYPVPEEDTTCLTELYYTQFFSPQLGFFAGRMSLRLPTPFTGDETSQFMNTALFVPPVLGTTFPLTTTAVGVIFIPTKWLEITTLVADSEGAANVTGFDPDTVFTSGTSVVQIAQATIKPFDLSGHQGVIWSWSDKNRIQFEQSAFAIIDAIRQGNTDVLGRSSDDWTVNYTFDQYVYTLPDKPDEGIGVFGYCGVGPGVVNPIRACYSLGVGGKGLIPGRATDTYGVGYYFINLTDELPRIIERRVEDEQGVELYYNIAVTPWLHVSPDLQFIDPARSKIDTTVVAGLRMKIDF
jgi:porin